MKKYLIIIITFLALVFGYVFYSNTNSPDFLGAVSATRVATSTSYAVTTTSGECLAANPSRISVEIVNDAGVAVYISPSYSAAVANRGIRLNATGGSYSIDQNNLWTGPIQCITGSGTSTVTIYENQ